MNNNVARCFAFVILASLSGCVSADPGTYEPVSPFRNKQVLLGDSWIKERQELNRKYLHSLDPDRLLHNFRMNAGLGSTAPHLEGWEHPECGLKGHFVGHYLSACARLVERDGDALLSQRLVYMVDALKECQQSLGGKYLSAFPESDFATLETQYGGVWAPYYTYHKIMQGLLDVYTRTGNAKAYEVVQGMADYVADRMARLPEEEIEKILYTVQANPSNEAGGMNDVLHQLYRVSGNEKHLALARLFDRDWFSNPLSENKDILSGLHANTHIVLVQGYAKRHENTGEEKYYDAAVNFWEMLVNHHCYANGTSSGPRPIATTPTAETAEHWGKADGLSTTFSGKIAESCVTHNTQKLTAELFTWAADPKYADAFMNTYFNGVLASQNGKTGQTVYHLPLASPRKKAFLTEADFRCCNGSAVEAFAGLNEGIYYHTDRALWVNLYVPSVLEWDDKGVSVTQSGNFAEKGNVAFVINTANEPVPLDLKFLIPSWATGKVVVTVNGKAEPYAHDPLSYLTISRMWKDNDRIELRFDLDFYMKATADNKHVAALFYGPNLMAFETYDELIFKGDAESVISRLSAVGNDLQFSFRQGERQYQLKPFHQITGEDYGVYFTIENDK